MARSARVQEAFGRAQIESAVFILALWQAETVNQDGTDFLFKNSVAAGVWAKQEPRIPIGTRAGRIASCGSFTIVYANCQRLGKRVSEGCLSVSATWGAANVGLQRLSGGLFAGEQPSPCK